MSAAILQFPATVQRQARRRMNRAEVTAHRDWIRQHAARWATEQTERSEPPENLSPGVRQLMNLLDEEWGAVKQPTVTQLRREIAEGRKLIKKRNRVKAWLAAMGVHADNMKDPEQALFAAFEKLS